MTEEEHLEIFRVIEVGVPSHLADCFLHCLMCEEQGSDIENISSEEQAVEKWMCSKYVRDRPFAPRIAMIQLQALIAIAEDKSHKLSSPFLNAHTQSEEGRDFLLSFLRKFETSLSNLIQRS